MNARAEPDDAPGLTVRMTRNAAGVITSVGDEIVDVLGWRPDQLTGLPSTTFLHPEDQASAIAAWMEMITSPGSTRVWRGRYQAADGTWRWVETVNVLEDGENPLVVSIMKQVTVEQATIEEELRAREQLLSRLSDALPVGVFQIDAARHVTFTNDRFHAIVGDSSQATIEAQMHAVVADDQPRLAAALAAALDDRSVDDIEIRLQRDADAGAGEPTERVCVLSLRTLTDGVGVVTGAVGCISDETDRALLRRELEVRASVDELTSCLNRSATLALLERTMRSAADHEQGNAVVFIDLDEFKSVNDRYGHPAGDQLLIETARRLRVAVRENDHVGRLGGDEFLVICPHVTSAARAMQIAERILETVTGPADVGVATVELRASLGVAWTSGPLDPDTFIAQADSAMYDAKRTGVRLVLFDPHAA